MTWGHFNFFEVNPIHTHTIIGAHYIESSPYGYPFVKETGSNLSNAPTHTLTHKAMAV